MQLHVTSASEKVGGGIIPHPKSEGSIPLSPAPTPTDYRQTFPAHDDSDDNWNCIGKKSFRLNSRYIKFAKVNVFLSGCFVRNQSFINYNAYKTHGAPYSRNVNTKQNSGRKKNEKGGIDH